MAMFNSWVNYNELTASSLEITVSKGNHPQIALILYWDDLGCRTWRWVCLKMSCTPKPNGLADHYPYEKWLFHGEYTLFSDKPILGRQ